LPAAKRSLCVVIHLVLREFIDFRYTAHAAIHLDVYIQFDSSLLDTLELFLYFCVGEG
jgi:hypothetical protein